MRNHAFVLLDFVGAPLWPFLLVTAGPQLHHLRPHQVGFRFLELTKCRGSHEAHASLRELNGFLRLSRKYEIMLCRDCIGIIFPSSLLSTSKERFQQSRGVLIAGRTGFWPAQCLALLGCC